MFAHLGKLDEKITYSHAAVKDKNYKNKLCMDFQRNDSGHRFGHNTTAVNLWVAAQSPTLTSKKNFCACLVSRPESKFQKRIMLHFSAPKKLKGNLR